MFASESLSLVGETYATSPYARKSCEYLIGKQREDGGWGESYQVRFCVFVFRVLLVMAWVVDLWFSYFRGSQSCEQTRWVEHRDTQVVQTCWAVMALIYAKYPYPEPIERGVRLVMSRQKPVRLSCLFIASPLIDETPVGRFVASRSHRRCFQQDMRDFVSQLQVRFPDLDVRKGGEVLGAVTLCGCVNEGF